MDFSTISMPMAALLASLIGATATITASLLQLRMAWKKELTARANHKPVTRKARRGPIMPVVALLVASAIGGFALSFYLGSKERASAEAREVELRTKIDQLITLSQQLESVGHNGSESVAELIRLEEQNKYGAAGVAAMVVLEKCIVAPSTEAVVTECDESSARTVQLCTEIPADSSVTGIELFARSEGDARSWSESRVTAGSDFGGGRFTPQSSERLINEMSKQVCQEVKYWNSMHALNGRMVVHYSRQ